MSNFNKLFSKIAAESINLNNNFPTDFNDAPEALEFIWDIMPTYGPQYDWHTLEDLQKIPELLTLLGKQCGEFLIDLGNEFGKKATELEQVIAGYEDDPQSEDAQIKIDNYLAIDNWLKDMAQKNSTACEDLDGYTTSDQDCFNTPPDPEMIKEVRPRHYRRGLKALSLANRRKFNKLQSREQIQQKPVEEPEFQKIEKKPMVAIKHNVQQPVSKSTIFPPAGVNRPVKSTFSDIVYRPSITAITKEVKARAKARCKQLVSESDDSNDKEFTTCPFGSNYKKEANVDKAVQKNLQEKQDKKMLCAVCKEYVDAKEIKNKNGLLHYECPKCGGRLNKGNILK